MNATNTSAPAPNAFLCNPAAGEKYFQTATVRGRNDAADASGTYVNAGGQTAALGGLELDGDRYVAIGADASIKIAGNFSISAWVADSDSSPSPIYSSIFDMGGGPDSDNVMCGKTDGGKLRCNVYDGRNNQEVRFDAWNANNSWFHVAFMMTKYNNDTSSVQVFVDGVQKLGPGVNVGCNGTTAAAGCNHCTQGCMKAPNDVWRTKMWVGRSNWGKRITGALAGFRLHDRALTAAEVAEVVKGGINGTAATADAKVFLPLVGQTSSPVGGSTVEAHTDRTVKEAMGQLLEKKCENTPSCSPPPSPPPSPPSPPPSPPAPPPPPSPPPSPPAPPPPPSPPPSPPPPAEQRLYGFTGKVTLSGWGANDITSARLEKLCDALKKQTANTSAVDCQAVPPVGSPAASGAKRHRARSLLAGTVAIDFDLFGFMSSSEATTAATAIQSKSNTAGSNQLATDIDSGGGISATFSATEVEVESLDAAYLPAKVALTETQLRTHLNDPQVATVLLRRHITLTAPLNIGDRGGSSVALVANCTPDTSAVCTASNDRKCTIKGTQLQGNIVAYMEPGSTLTVRFVRFKGGKNVENGGAIWARSRSTASNKGNHFLHLDGCDFVDNESEWDGGAVYAEGGLLIEDSTFTNNIAKGDGGGGGALRVANTAASGFRTPWLSLKSVTFTGNNATGSGGSGGAVYTTGALDATGCVFTSNQAKGKGGAIAAFGANLTDIGGSYNSNTAVNGGAVAMEGGVFETKNSIMTSNTATVYGGAVYTWVSTTQALNFQIPVHLNGATLTKNKAADGAGVYAPGVSVWVKNSDVSYNEATRRGGGLYSESGAETRNGVACLGTKLVVKIERSNVMHNYAKLQGGGIFLWNAACEADAASHIAFNYAADGGGVVLIGTKSDFNNSDGGIIKANTGGVYSNMDSNTGSKSPDISDTFRVGVWYDVCKTKNRYTAEAHSALTNKTINYCPTGGCNSPHESTGCPAYSAGGGCGIYDPVKLTSEPVSEGYHELRECPRTGYVQFPDECVEVKAGDILSRGEGDVLQRTAIRCFAGTYLLQPGEGLSAAYNVTQCKACPQGFTCAGGNKLNPLAGWTRDPPDGDVALPPVLAFRQAAPAEYRPVDVMPQEFPTFSVELKKAKPLRAFNSTEEKDMQNTFSCVLTSMNASVASIVSGATGTNGEGSGSYSTSEFKRVTINTPVGVDTKLAVHCTVAGSAVVNLTFTTRRQPCDKGYVLSEDKFQCVKCPPGTFSTASDGIFHGGPNENLECEECPANGFCPGGHVGLCMPGFYASRDLNPVGFKALAVGDACTACPVGATCAADALVNASSTMATTVTAQGGNVTGQGGNKTTFEATEMMVPILAELWNDTVVLTRLAKMGGLIGGPIVVQGGYWRWSNSTPGVYQCPYEGLGCQAETLSSTREVIGTGSCNGGHRGNLCQQCQKSYAASANGECKACGNASNIMGVALSSVCIVVAGCFAYWFLIWRPLTPVLAKKFDRTMTRLHSTIGQNLNRTLTKLHSTVDRRKVTPESVPADSPSRAAMEDVVVASMSKTAAQKWKSSLTRMKKGSTLSEMADMIQKDFDGGYMSVEEFVELSRSILKIMERRKRTIVASIKIIITFYQIMSTLPFVLSNVQWPTFFADVASVTSVFNLDIVKIPSLACLSPGSFFSRLVLYIFAPLAVFVVLVGTSLLGSVLYKNHPNIEEFQDGIYYNMNLFLFLVYPTVSATAFATFACADVDGTWLLKEDYDVQCFTGEHAGKYTIMGIIGVVLYAIGIPLYTVFVLIKDGILEVAQSKKNVKLQEEIILHAVLEGIVRWDHGWKIQGGLHFDDLSEEQLAMIYTALVLEGDKANEEPGKEKEPSKVTRETMEMLLVDWGKDEGAQKIHVGELPFMAYDDVNFELTNVQKLERTLMKRHGLIFSAYHTGAPFFELFEMFRKLLLTSILQFVAPGSATQLTVATLLNFAALCVSFNWSPFLENSVDHFNQVSLVQLFLTTFSGLLLFVQPSGSADHLYFSIIIVISQFGLPAFPIVVKLWQAAGNGLDVVVATLVAKGIKTLLGDFIAELGETFKEIQMTAKEAVTMPWMKEVAEVADSVADGVKDARDAMEEHVAHGEALKDEVAEAVDAATGRVVTALKSAGADADDDMVALANKGREAVAGKAEGMLAPAKEKLSKAREKAQEGVDAAKSRLEALRLKLEDFLWSTWPGRVTGVLVKYAQDHPKVRRVVVKVLEVPPQAMTFMCELCDHASKNAERLAAAKEKNEGSDKSGQWSAPVMPL